MAIAALEMFRQACGWPAQLELDIYGPDGEDITRYELERPFALLGRGPHNDVRLSATKISSFHAYMQVLAGRPFVVDLGSRSGTRWQGESRSAGWFGPADRLDIGDFSIGLAPRSQRFLDGHSDSSQECDPLRAGSASRAGLPTFTLELADRRGNVQRLQVDRILTLVGRAPACRLRLVDQSVSKFHCAVVQTAHGLWAVDLLGRDGTWADGRRVRWARLGDGARLCVGRFVMRVRPDGDCLAQVTGPFLLAPSIVAPCGSEGSNGCAETNGPPEEAGATGTKAEPLVSRLGADAPNPEYGSLVPRLASPGVAIPTRVSDGAVPAAIMQQFASLHQHMLTQFQQGMLIMAQMFTTMRQEEMELLREVLDRLGGLRREVRGLKAAEKKRAARRPDARGEQPVEQEITEETEKHAATSDPPAAAVPSNGVAADPLPPPDSAPPSADSTIGANADASLHTWLTGRIAKLDKDRQSAWRKLIASIFGN